MHNVQCSVLRNELQFRLQWLLKKKKSLIADRSGSTVANCNVLRWGEYLTFSYSLSHSFGDAIVFTVYGCSNALQLATSSIIAKHWKLNWKLKQNDIMYFWQSQITYTITTLYYFIVVASMLCTPVHSAPWTRCRSVAFRSCLPVYFIVGILIFWFLSFEMESIKCFYFSRMN